MLDYLTIFVNTNERINILTMNKIRKKVLKKIEKDNVLIGLLMAHFNKSSMSIGRWIKANDVRLTLPSALKIISAETGLLEEEIVEAGDKVTTTV